MHALYLALRNYMSSLVWLHFPKYLDTTQLLRTSFQILLPSISTRNWWRDHDRSR